MTNNYTALGVKDLLFREELICNTRSFFQQAHFHEILSPVLVASVPNEPNIYPFETRWCKDQTSSSDISESTNHLKLFLSTSPESFLKKVLSGGRLRKVFSIAHSFRNLENSGELHTPEFLMLEWYSVDSNLDDLKKQVSDLIRFLFIEILKTTETNYQGHKISIEPTSISLNNLFREKFNRDLLSLSHISEITQLANQLGFSTTNSNWEQIFNQIFLNHIEPDLPKNLVFLTDFPAKISPLCKTQADSDHLAERFEVYLAGIEIGNGNTDATDWQRIQDTFNNDLLEKKRNSFTQQLDQDFIRTLKSLDQQKIQTAGIGVGLDRLQMIMQNRTEIMNFLDNFPCNEIGTKPFAVDGVRA